VIVNFGIDWRLGIAALSDYSGILRLAWPAAAAAVMLPERPNNPEPIPG
jgi:hypothetical protein